MRFPLWALLRLSRLDASLLGALSLFIPLAARTGDLAWSAERAIPLFGIYVCTFISNDLDDLERDAINHPDRPLPSGQVRPELAAGLYFVTLAVILFATRGLIEPAIAYWYYGLLILAISYRHVVDWFPAIKAVYVSGLAAVPVVIVALTLPASTDLYWIAGGLFLFCLGREICMDINDRNGDEFSVIHTIKASALAASAFILQGAAVLLLARQVSGTRDALVLVLLVLLSVIAGVFWFRRERPKVAVAIMKGQLALGLNFLA